MNIMNRQQRIIILSVLVLFLLLGLVPPWKYADGQFLGFRPAFNPPPLRDEPVSLEDVPAEHVPIQIVPQSLYNPNEASPLDQETLRKPFVDIRRMMSISTFLFLGGIVGVILTGKRPREQGSS